MGTKGSTNYAHILLTYVSNGLLSCKLWAMVELEPVPDCNIGYIDDIVKYFFASSGRLSPI